MTGYQFILVQCFSILFADFVASPGVEDYSGSMERSSFCSGRGPRQNDSMKLRKFRARPFRLNRFWRTSTTHYPAHQNVTFDQLWAGHHHPVLCSSTRGQGDSHPWGWGLLQKNICWIGNFRRSHQVGRRLTSSWHQKKTTWTAKICGIQTQKGGL